MTSNTLLVCVVATALSSLGSAAHAETFQWKDSNGQTIISDTPPPATAKNRRSIGGQQPSVVSEKPVEKAADGAKTAAAAGPKTTAEKDMEFKKRNGQSAFRHGIHGGREQRQVQGNVAGQPGSQANVAREDLRMCRDEKDVVESKGFLQRSHGL